MLEFIAKESFKSMSDRCAEGITISYLRSRLLCFLSNNSRLFLNFSKDLADKYIDN